MELRPNKEDPNKVDVAWLEADLQVLAAAYTEKLALQLDTSEDDEVSSLDLLMARAYTEKKEHLGHNDQLPVEWIESIVLTLKEFSDRSKEQALAAYKRSGLPAHANNYFVERLDLGNRALALASQFEDPKASAEVKKLEAALDLPMPGELPYKLALPTPETETDENI